MLTILKKKNSGIILGAGFCDFPTDENTETIQIDTDKIPDNIRLDYEISKNKMVSRKTKLTQDEFDEQSNERAFVMKKLAELDPLIPRCVEDLVAATNCLNSLPQIMQDRITAKSSLRQRLTELS